MYVCTSACMCVSMYLCIYVCMSVCTYVWEHSVAYLSNPLKLPDLESLSKPAI